MLSPVSIVSTRLSSWSPSLQFLLRFGILVLAYQTFFHFIYNHEELLIGYNAFSIAWIEVLLEITQKALHLIYETVDVDPVLRIVRIRGTIGVTVGEPCIGFDLMALYTGLIISTKASLRPKIKYILTGLVVINAINIVRIAALAALVEINPTIWELNHKVIFSVVAYAIIFLMWSNWIKHTPNKNTI